MMQIHVQQGSNASANRFTAVRTDVHVQGRTDLIQHGECDFLIAAETGHGIGRDTSRFTQIGLVRFSINKNFPKIIIRYGHAFGP